MKILVTGCGRVHRQEPDRAPGGIAGLRGAALCAADAGSGLAGAGGGGGCGGASGRASTGRTSPDEFAAGNAGLTERLCEALAASGRTIPVIFSSSTQAVQDNPYGEASGRPRMALWRYAAATGSAGLCVSPAECLRQMVPAELQLGRGHLLPQHRRGLPIRDQ